MLRTRLSITLLGRFQVVLDEQPIKVFESDRVRALLAYLAVESDTPHDRSTLAALLWPDQSELAARTNLRHVLLNLRHALHDNHAEVPFLLTTRQTIQWNPDSETWLDTTAFSTLIKTCETHTHLQLERCTECLTRLTEASALYHGRFLAGVSLPASTALEEWVRLIQERLQRHLLEALAHVTNSHELSGDYAAAVQSARRQVDIEPWREEAHRQLMRVLALAGRRSEALTQYHVFRRILAAELQVEPSNETRAVLERIQLDQLRPATARSVVHLDRAVERPLNNLPADVDAFIGRTAEVAAIHARLDLPYCRLVTLVGPGGAGKTRLAIAAARDRLNRYADGVCCVLLAGVSEQAAESTANTIAVAVAGSIGLVLSSGLEPRGQVCAALRDRHMLLVLDNFEHLMAGVDLISDILVNAPRVEVLITSRQVLNLHSEWLLEITGLPYLESDQAPAAALFEERCRQWRVQPIESPDERAAIQRICRLVEGLPLAIELAAALTRTESCAAIADRITHNLGELATTLRDVPARQRSLRAVFDASWQQLTSAEQIVLAQVSVFSGSFSLEAVLPVAQADAATLRALQDKSFLHQPQPGRYTLHEVLRFFAAEKLAELAATSDRLADTAGRHSAYYLSLVSRHALALGGAQSQQAVQDILSELDNVRRAWQWAVDHVDLDAIRRHQPGLGLFYLLAGLLHEGAAVLAQTIDQLHARLATAPEPATELKVVLNRLHIEQCHIFRRLSQYAPALASAYEAIGLAQAIGDAAGEAGARYVAGLVLWYQAEYVAARQQAEEALHYYRVCGDPIKESRACNLLGGVMIELGQYALATEHFEQALRLSRAAGDRIGESMELANLGQLHGRLGDYGRERACYLEALPIQQQSSEPRLYAKTLCDLGFNHYRLGQTAPARDCYEQSLIILRRAGDRAWEAVVVVRLSLLFQRLAAMDEARTYAAQALAIARSIGHRDYEGAALMQLGRISAAAHRWAEADVDYRQALAVRQALGQAHGLPEIQADLAWLAMQQGQLEQARLELAPVLCHLETQPTLAGAIEPLRVWLICYCVLKVLADGQATLVLNQAYQLLSDQAARIDDESVRQSFLNNVPTNTEIVALWKATSTLA